MEHDLRYMRLALKEAKKGLGRTSPNPCVGAVIVRDDEVIAQGDHRRAGTPHAEVNAIADALEKGMSCVGATIYVTLEPCNHTGRTPPCTQAILTAGFRRVVIGMADPNPVASGGADFLRSQGLEVKLGVLEQECRQLNYPFLKHSVSGLPWVVMKAGMSLDGKISRRQGAGGAITGPEAKKRVHLLRDQLDAILIGSGTALIDDPSLTTRLGDRADRNEAAGQDPVRVILDSRLRLSPYAKMLTQNSSAPTWIFCDHNASEQKQKELEQAGAVVHRVESDQDGGLDLNQVLRCLGQADITSVLVEGGAAVHGSFLQKKLVDQVYLFTAPYFIGEQGTSLLSGYSLGEGEAPLCLENQTTEIVGQDILLQGLLC
ncbi:bifunctional diaminohydroxyphosphoribosylaminopyrimidine deaminase/5-amino-6-(5-phosphoribosylamino)uracil reductase RibD [Candidatus Electrothrix sp.]|uniref:bifunctional diaminohydroxyphosphoribosylaminopyrimidine deaminase/5-amino-6-(5-phosphoribosylamino)uracil reductase RibD n=1 Tax=Candidatus Electrothrix sp. TaxID=2170559 RepID=UPI0040572BB6